MAFSYTPSDGLNNTSSYKTTPDTEALARSQFMDLFNQVKDYLNNSTFLQPTGSILTCCANIIPSGYLKANGDLVSRTTYANLWAYANASGNIVVDGAWTKGSFSTGDGSATFRIPDLRGYFIRGWDDGAGVDSGRTFGSTQADDFKIHSHGIQSASVVTASGTFTSTIGQGSGTQSGTTGGTETRPKNVALLTCIKF